MDIENLKVTPWDARRDLLIPGDRDSTLDAATRHFSSVCHSSIEKRGKFCVALSGGSTPKAIFERLSQDPYRTQISWDKVYLFWGDERSVPPTSDESNYKMAMDAGFGSLPVPKEQIFRMQAEADIEKNAALYEETLKAHLTNGQFDLVMLGMGEDGHTASLFPQTEGLDEEEKLAVANYVPQKNTWRMSLTYPAINSSRHIAIYVIGNGKKETLFEVLNSPFDFERYPIQKVGTEQHKALWIIDDAAAGQL